MSSRLTKNVACYCIRSLTQVNTSSRTAVPLRPAPGMAGRFASPLLHPTGRSRPGTDLSARVIGPCPMHGVETGAGVTSCLLRSPAQSTKSAPSAPLARTLPAHATPRQAVPPLIGLIRACRGHASVQRDASRSGWTHDPGSPGNPVDTRNPRHIIYLRA
jgi:hypothetical protein